MTSVTIFMGFLQQLQAVLAHALERVGRRARLVGPAAEDGHAHRGELLRGLEEHLPVLDRAGAGHDDDLIAADGDVADADDGVLALNLAGGQLVGLAHPHHLDDARELLEQRRLELAGADDGDDRTLLALDQDGTGTGPLDVVLDAAELVVAQSLFQDDDHKSPQIRAWGW
jgi:hypothetical protein